MLWRLTTIARRQIKSEKLILSDLSSVSSLSTQLFRSRLQNISTSTRSFGAARKPLVSNFDQSPTSRLSASRKPRSHQALIESILYAPKDPKRKQMSRSGGVPFARGSRGRRPQDRGRGSYKGTNLKPRAPPLDVLPGPFHDEKHIFAIYNPNNITLKPTLVDNPKSPLSNYVNMMTGDNPVYEFTEGAISPNETKKICRARVLADKERGIYGIGDAPTRKEAEKLAALSACIQLSVLGLLDKQKKAADVAAVLSDGAEVSHERARMFIDWYCRRFSFGKPEIVCHQLNNRRGNPGWQATLLVADRSIGIGTGSSKKAAQVQCYGDACKYLESSDRAVWEGFMEWAKSKDASMVPPVYLQISDSLDDDIHDLCEDMQNSQLYANKPPPANKPGQTTSSKASHNLSRQSHKRPPITDAMHENQSKKLLESLVSYEEDSKLAPMRTMRHSLPVMAQTKELLEQIEKNDVTICMAATGSGKTTQIPQIILDGWIRSGKGSRCNILCTEPRRIAAISVAERVAKERAEPIGQSIGYQVRFEAKPPRDNGGVTFCTTGIFLKRMQSALQHSEPTGRRAMDNITHIIIDEVHERDVDTDLALVVLKRLLQDRKSRGIPIKIVLMSATINPTLFQKYFADADGKPAPVVEVPGRLFPVEKKFLDGIVDDVEKQTREDPDYSASRWVFKEKNVSEYLARELGPTALAKFNAPPPLSRTASSAALSAISASASSEEETHDELEMPYPLIALTIAHVLKQSEFGHVLVFMPGWDEIVAVQRLLEDTKRPLLNINFTDQSKYSLHLLHSTVPVSEQQAVFEPPPSPDVRRIILATNIAETSITIPNVVYVVDAAKVKEIRYDPQRHMSSLVSAWISKSNLNQRAGRAGRHLPGEYFGILPQSRADSLPTHQVVEMKRSDLSNVVMHVKALNFPGMGVEEVLAALIEPPAPDNVQAALTNLKMVGALDEHQNLTSLGKVLQQLPLDVNLGRLLLLGSLFKCLDQALSLVAILSHRDPFMSPIQLKKEANAAKERFTSSEFRSDTLAILSAYNEWAPLYDQKDPAASRFCMENFLSKTTLMSIHKLRGHLLHAVENAGVLAISAGGHGGPPVVGAGRWARNNSIRISNIPDSLNSHGSNTALLAALIAVASQPNFAIRTSEVTYRTSQDKHTFIHPSSVNHRKRQMVQQEGIKGEKQLYTFQEKSQNISNVNTQPIIYLRNCTRLDPMTYMLFGAYQVEVTEKGLDCDGWLPVVGNVDVLDDVQRLKTLMDGCMLRVFEGICHWKKTHRQEPTTRSQAVYREESKEDETVDDETEASSVTQRQEVSLSSKEINELNSITTRIVRILDRFAEERSQNHSRTNSRPVTPASSRPGTPGVSRPGTPGGGSSPSMNHNLRLPASYVPSRGFPSWSGYNTPIPGANTPYVTSAFNSRPATPSGLGGPGRYLYP